jgi:hypothetical protein
MTTITLDVDAPNMALNLAPFGHWTLRDEAAQVGQLIRS